jgi:Na+/melibiose symporter-like transporter
LKRDRVFYWIESAFEWLITILCSGAFLAKLTGAVGISDSTTAILTSIISFASLAQFASIYISHKAPVKRFVIPITLVSNLLMSALFLLPLVSTGGSVTVIFFIVFLVARFLISGVTAVKTTWFFNLVPEDKKGMFVAITHITSLVAGMIFSLIAGRIVDEFEARGNLNGAFITLSICILIFSVINFLSLVLSKEKETSWKEEGKEKLGDSLRELFKNKNYRGLCLVQLLNSVGCSIAMPFFGTYQINELGFSITYVTVISLIYQLTKLFSVAIFGKLSSRLSNKKILLIAFPLYSLSYFVMSFTAPQNGRVLYVAFVVILYVGVGALSVADTNMLLSVVPRGQQTAALSFNAIISGITCFATTVAISPLLDFIQSHGNRLFGITVYAQQILSLAACIIYLVTAICLKTLVKEKPRELSSEET